MSPLEQLQQLGLDALRMIPRITITDNTNEVIAALERQKSAIRKAMVVAVNRTAELVQEELSSTTKGVFDRPTPTTVAAPRLARATDGDDPVAVVYLRNSGGIGSPDAYLDPEIRGGARVVKRFEIALRRAGVMPDGYFAVPGRGAELDSYGNMSRRQLAQVLAYFQVNRPTSRRRNLTAAQRGRLARGTKTRLGFEYFVGRPGGGRLPLGVWQRVQFSRGTALRPVLIFVPRVQYRELFDFYGVANSVIEREWPVEFERALVDAG